MANKKKEVDWEAVEIAYRAGVKTLRQIGEENGVSHTLIARRAKTHAWVRDLAPKIRAKADSLVSKAAVTSNISTETLNEEVEANAQMQANIRLAQRGDITRSRRLVMSLLTELEQQTGNTELFEKLAELLIDDAGEEDKSQSQNKRWEAFNKAVSLGGRTDTMKKLAESLKTLVGLEREAFGIDDRSAGQQSVGEFLENA